MYRQRQQDEPDAWRLTFPAAAVSNSFVHPLRVSSAAISTIAPSPCRTLKSKWVRSEGIPPIDDQLSFDCPRICQNQNHHRRCWLYYRHLAASCARGHYCDDVAALDCKCSHRCPTAISCDSKCSNVAMTRSCVSVALRWSLLTCCCESNS